MPLYTFKCTACGPFETWQTIKELDEDTLCPTCHSIAKRVYGSPALITTPQSVRRRIEYGAEPKRVTRAHDESTHSHTPHSHTHTHHRTHRPWQVGH